MIDIRTDEQIEETIKIIKGLLAKKAINRYVNSSVKEGYLKVVEILSNRVSDYEAAGIKKLSTPQSRAIALLAVDYLNGICGQKVLTGVPIKNKR